MTRLAAFDPRVAGTFPLGLAVSGSDIDVLCHAPDADAFAAALWDACGDFEDFAMWQWRKADRPVIAVFSLAGVPFEIFGQAQPVEAQHGWRHFAVEARLLRLGGADLHEAVMAARRAGAKTEPAFARVLGLEGDPYLAMLALADRDDDGLREVLQTRGSPGAFR
ncbi:DUF4269 domain-containing protein [Novosphingobium sp. TCA1]|uniref:DUF4269 domain-containing protein n=1 Tax=Novosphingobium sp. TCA1 TaxID=2682474 RepID=UPI001F16077C|nr:DUF4269 domain-containing protein [Novosphingobium sp. TCA1]